MSTSAQPDHDSSKVDHDLLTYGEVGVRLGKEVAAQQLIVTALNAAGDAALDAAIARLEALREAADRNRHRPINSQNFESFFGIPDATRHQA
jgi:hypothetical protein